MEEIKVGEYVRTQKGEICKVLGIRQEQRTGKRVYGHLAYYLDNRKGSLTPAFIVKHSFSIIDLIEEGDFVNGYKVSFIYEDYAKFVQCDYSVEVGTTNHYKFYEKSIKNIVTKEQFKAIEYKVEE